MPENRLGHNHAGRRLFYLVMFLIPVVVISSTYLAYTGYRTYSIYNNVKAHERGWTGHVHKADDELGFVPVANSSGSETMPAGPDIPMKYDKDGFRIPVEDEPDTNNKHPIILALGDSFTYGAATCAEDTFPYLVGKYLEGTTKNAGVCSYGLVHMVLLAKRLIPLHKPDYVIVQYSPWLVGRATQVFAPSYFGKVPVPYYSGDSNPVIRPPVFKTKVLELPVDEYRGTQKSLTDFILFVWNVGLPLFLHDDFNMSVYKLSGSLGLKEVPTTNYGAVIQNAYNDIFNIAKQNGATVIFLILGNTNETFQIKKEFFPEEVLFVDAHRAMVERLPVKDMKNYALNYWHLSGNPPKMEVIDVHPNKTAHRIIANEIISSIVR